MSDRWLVALVVVVVALLWVWAWDVKAQFPDFECPEQRVCPRVPACSSVSKWEINLRAAEENPLDLITLQMEFGEQIVDRTVVCCVVLTGIATDSDGVVSEPSDIYYGGDECQPVPEPGVGLGLSIGVLALAWRGGIRSPPSLLLPLHIPPQN